LRGRLRIGRFLPSAERHGIVCVFGFCARRAQKPKTEESQSTMLPQAKPQIASVVV
jgi:hypothetical protein